jgi:dipeptidyl aminopeptidase/acylaminoacyl peptidase
MKRLLAGLAGLAALATANAQDPSQIPVIDFVKDSEAMSARLSPNGDYLAIEYTIENKRVVAIMELATGKITTVLKFSVGESVGRYVWVNPTRLVVSLARGFGALDQPYLTGELFGIDASGKNGTYLFGYQGRGKADTRIQVGVANERASAYVVATLRDDPDHMLIQTRPWADKSATDTLASLVRMNVKNGQRKIIDQLPMLVPDVIADPTGRILFVAGLNRDSQWELRARTGDDKPWVTVEVPRNPSRADVDLHTVSTDGASAYFSAGGDKAPTCLYEYGFASGATTQLACGEFNSVLFSPVDRRPYGLTYEDGLPRTEFLLPDHPEAKRLKAISGAFPGQRVTPVSVTADSSKVLLRVNSDRNPGAYYLLDEATKKLRPLVPARRWIDPRLMAPVAPVTVKASDGLQIPAYLTARDGQKTRQAPLIVLPHGGPVARDYWGWDNEAQLLASRGYAVLQVNFRGSYGYGQDFETAGYRNWGTRVMQDIAEATRWAIAEGIADPARICIYGGSFGGYSALMSAAREPDLYRCAAGFAGVYDLEEQTSDSGAAFSVLGRAILEDWYGTDKAALRADSPITHAARIKAPVFLAHGTSDTTVLFSQSKAMRKALDAAKKPYEWHEYSGEEHGWHKDENAVDFYTKLLAFFDKHIGKGAGG